MYDFFVKYQTALNIVHVYHLACIVKTSTLFQKKIDSIKVYVYKYSYQNQSSCKCKHCSVSTSDLKQLKYFKILCLLH